MTEILDRRTDFRLRAPGLLLLGLLAAGATGPAAAQSRPSIGLVARGAMVFVEEGEGIHAPAENDRFGSAFAAADFNLDGFDDLAIGIPGNDCGTGGLDFGSVQVRFGGILGLSPALVLDPAGTGQGGEAPPNPAQPMENYGAALAAGDFNHDGYADLAVGAPKNVDADQYISGGVQIHYGLHGSLGSIEWVAEHGLDQGTAGMPGDARSFELFGASLAAGDFNGDGHDDLAIGAPADVDLSSDFPQPRTGNVVVPHGHIGGLFPVEAFEMALGLDGLPDSRENLETFGHALAAGDFNHDNYEDLAIGVPREDDVGAVLVVYGSPFSLLFADNWYFGLFDLAAEPQAGARFGLALAAGDFNDDGYDDLAVGAPFFDGPNGVPQDVGIVTIVHGSSDGLSEVGPHFFWQDNLGVDPSEDGDLFGSALAAGDFNGDGVDDLAIGSEGEDLGGAVTAGAVTVRMGVAGVGVAGAARQLFNGAYPRAFIPEPRLGEARWGATLAAGDFDGNGFSDLAIGAPNRDTPGEPLDTGAAAVIYGQLYFDGFETDDTLEWTALAP